MLKDNLKGLWIPIEILIDDNLSDKEKLIYSILLFFSAQNGSCTITNNLIIRYFRNANLTPEVENYIEKIYSYSAEGKDFYTPKVQRTVSYC